MFSLGEVRVYVLDDLLRRLGKDCEVCVYGPAKRRFLTNECCKCIERAEKLVHTIVPDKNYISKKLSPDLKPQMKEGTVRKTTPDRSCALTLETEVHLFFGLWLTNYLVTRYSCVAGG